MNEMQWDPDFLDYVERRIAGELAPCPSMKNKVLIPVLPPKQGAESEGAKAWEEIPRFDIEE